jgi:hypothetical protein
MIARILTMVASGLGYVPPGKDWISKLQALRGEFRRSARSTALLVLISATGIIGAAVIGVAELGPYHGLRNPNPILLAMSLVLLVLAIGVPWRRYGVTYVFEGGQLTCVSGSGAVRWSESLGGLTGVACTSFQGQRSMTLLWHSHRRSIELYDSLWDVLNTNGRR